MTEPRRKPTPEERVAFGPNVETLVRSLMGLGADPPFFDRIEAMPDAIDDFVRSEAVFEATFHYVTDLIRIWYRQKCGKPLRPLVRGRSREVMPLTLRSPGSHLPVNPKPDLIPEKQKKLQNESSLLVYILVDVSKSMQGEYIHAINAGLQSMITAFRHDSWAKESALVSMITFDQDSYECFSMKTPDEWFFEEVYVGLSKSSFFGPVLKFLSCKVYCDRKSIFRGIKHEWKPLLFVFTDGNFSDYRNRKSFLKELSDIGFGAIVFYAVGYNIKTKNLNELADKVVVLETMDAAEFSALIRWVPSD